MNDTHKTTAISKLKKKGLFCFYCLNLKNDKLICCNSNKFSSFMHLPANSKKLLIDKEVTQ